MKTKYIKALLPVLIGLILFLLPAPAGLSSAAWRYFAVFAGVVIGLILEPLPAAAVGFIGVAIVALFGLASVDPKVTTPDNWISNAFATPLGVQAASIRWALSGFADGTVWLIFAAFMFALGYQKTGLGKRLGLMLVKLLGKNTLGLGYAVAFSDLILAPFMPSNTARSGGTLFPILRNIPALYGSEPGPTARKIGSYIMWTALSVTCVTSSMFLTALAPNLAGVTQVKNIAKINIEWTQWATGFLPAGIILILAVPILAYFLYPPEVKKSADVPKWAGEELAKMGAISRNEILMAVMALIALVLWIQNLVNGTIVALVVISLMLVLKIISWDDVLNNKQAWNVLVWFATLVALASGLQTIGFTQWIGQGAAQLFAGQSATTVMILLVVVFFVSHYLFASVTAHVAAMMPVILAAGVAVPGMNITVLSLMLLYALGLMGIITPYGTGPSPIYFGSNYVDKKSFWLLGLIFGAIYLAVLLLVETPYLLMLYPK